MKQYIFLLIIFSANLLSAQQTTNLIFRNSTLNASGNQLPFWLHANQNGKFEESTQFLNLTELNAKTAGIIGKSRWRYQAGTNLIAGLANENYFRANQLFGGLQYTKFILKAGWFPNETRYNVLSSTNGDIHWSNNIRPLPRIRLSADYFRFSFFPSWLQVKGMYEEALLNDNNRFVQNAHLHHKNVLLKFSFNNNLFIVIGLDHYSQWGGVHPTLGKLPAGIGDYHRYVLGLPGSEEFIKGDQSLMAGNQLGKYIIQLKKQFKNSTLEFYLNHPFTDRMDWSNYKDNLAGLYFKKNNTAIISEIIYEFMYTKFQRAVFGPDGNYTIPGGGGEPYFRHGIYRSGLSYKNRMFVTPFAVPLVLFDGINHGTGNNRIVLHHIGLSGYFSEQIQWKSLLSYSINHGTLRQIYHQVVPGFFDTPRRQISALGEIIWNIPRSNWSLHGALAIDKGQLLPDNTGGRISIQYKVF